MHLRVLTVQARLTRPGGIVRRLLDGPASQRQRAGFDGELLCLNYSDPLQVAGP